MAQILKGKSIKEILSFLLVIIIMTALIILSNVVGFFGTGFESQIILFQFFNYGIIFLLGVLVTISGFIYELLQKEGDEKYGNTLFFNSQGEKPSVSFFKKLSTFRLFLLSTIIFSIIGLFTVFRSQKQFTMVPSLAQQFTPAGNLIYSSLLIPLSENMGAVAVIVIIAIFLRIFARKYKWSPGTFNSFAYLLIPISTGIFGVANHVMRYQGSDINLFTVAIFWAIGGLITVFTGSFIPFWVMHITNNFFIDINRYFSSNIVMPIVIVIIIILIGFFIYLSYKSNKREIYI